MKIKKFIVAFVFLFVLTLSFKVSGDEVQTLKVETKVQPSDEKVIPAEPLPAVKEVVPAPKKEVFQEGLSKDEAGSKDVLKGKNVKYCLSYNKDKWEILENKINPNAEFLLKLKGKDAFGLIIPETTPVQLQHMPEVIKFNAEKAGMKDAAIVKQEMKNINGNDVLFIEWEGTFEPINAKIVYLGLVYSGEKGTVQVYTYTTKELADQLKKDMEEFVKGFCLINEEAPAVS